MKMKTTITITPTKSTTKKHKNNEDVSVDQAASCMQSLQQTHEKSATTTMMSLQQQ